MAFALLWSAKIEGRTIRATLDEAARSDIIAKLGKDEIARSASEDDHEQAERLLRGKLKLFLAMKCRY